MRNQQVSYRQLLKQVFEERTISNPRYSLRAMAKQLDLSPATLSSVMRGKKNFSNEMAISVTKKIGLNESESEIFLQLVQLESTTNEDLKIATLKRLKDLGGSTQAFDLSLEHFKMISDWYHFAILALTEIIDVTPDSVSRALDIPKVTADLAIGRLVNLEMLTLNDGHYKKTSPNPRAVSVAPNQALRTYHEQTLQKAIQSLESQTNQEKFVGSETIAFDPSQLDEFKVLTENYLDQVLKLKAKSNKNTEVYHLGIQFFRLTKSRKIKNQNRTHAQVLKKEGK